jgi:hypothetical protein
VNGIEHFDAVIRRAGGSHNRYRWDRKLGAIRYVSSHEEQPAPFEIGDVLDDHGEPLDGLTAIVRTPHPTFPGCVIRCRVAGGAVIDGHVVVYGAADGQEGEPMSTQLDPRTLSEAIRTVHPSAGSVELLSRAAAIEALSRVRQQAAERARWSAVSGAAWKAAPGSGSSALPYTWAERLVPRLPLRFQRYVADLLFQDERILFFLHHPSFAASRRRLPLFRAGREEEGLLLVTDRAVMVLRDVMPTGPSMVHWGYRVWVTAIERVDHVELEEAEESVQWRMRVRAADAVTEACFRFPRDATGALDEVLPVLQRFGSPFSAAVRRVYPPSPLWREPGTEIGKPVSGMDREDTASGPVAVDGTHVRVRSARGDAAAIAISTIASIALTKALVGCSVELTWCDGGHARETTIRFPYPEAPRVLQAVAELRHRLGQPEALLNLPDNGR